MLNIAGVTQVTLRGDLSAEYDIMNASKFISVKVSGLELQTYFCMPHNKMCLLNCFLHTSSNGRIYTTSLIIKIYIFYHNLIIKE